MQHKILLLDELGEKWGKTHVYHNLRTPADALKLLCINHPDFAKNVFELQKQGIFYKVQQVDNDLELSDLFLPLGKHDLVITPVVTGSGNAGKFILGAVLIGIAISTGGVGFGLGPAGFAGGFSTTLGSFSAAALAGNIGVALVLSGVSDMLTPQEKVPSFSDTSGAFTNYGAGPASIQKGADGQQTYAYTGATNVSGLGKTIPVAYGKVLIGSLLVGADIQPETIDGGNVQYFREPGTNTFTINGDKLTSKFSDHGGIRAKRLKGPKNLKKVGVPKLFSDGRRIRLKGHPKFNNDKGNPQVIRLNTDSDQDQHVVPQGFSPTPDSSFIGREGGSHGVKRTCIAFEIRGLIDRIGDADSTFIDGFITFQILIFADDKSRISGQHQVTIQGMLLPNQRERFILRIPHAHVGTDNYKIFIKVIDKSVIVNKCRFICTYVGQSFK